MKLCKQVCKQCLEKIGYKWHPLFEKNWQNGLLRFCWPKFNRIMVDINEMPDGCLYKLEHIVLGDQDEDEAE